MLTTLFTNFWRSQPTPGKSSGDPRGGRDPPVENRCSRRSHRLRDSLTTRL